VLTRTLQKWYGFERRAIAVEDLDWDSNGERSVSDSMRIASDVVVKWELMSALGSNLDQNDCKESRITRWSVDRRPLGRCGYLRLGAGAVGIVGTGTVTNYNFTVSGDSVADSISSSSAEDAIESGTHAYNFSGELTDLSVTGNVEVSLNGELVEGANGSWERHLIVFDGSVDDEVSSYQLAVSGWVVPSEEHTTNPGGEWDSLESDVGENTAVGVVYQGKDAYWFTGDITELEIRGSAIATFQSVD
jgi:hypothetical protein